MNSMIIVHVLAFDIIWLQNVHTVYSVLMIAPDQDMQLEVTDMVTVTG